MAAAVLLSVAAIFAVLVQLHQRIADMRQFGRDNAYWVASQLQFEMLRLEAAAANYALGDESDEELTRRLDIVWSRLNILEESYVAELLRKRNIDMSMVATVRNWLEDLDETSFGQSGSPITADERLEKANALRKGAEAFEQDLQDLSLSVLRTETLEHQRLHDSLSMLSRWLNALTVFVLGILGFFVTFLWIDGVRSRAAASEMRTLAMNASAAMRAKDNFISLVSHELRTPLTSIYGSIELLKADEASGLSKAQAHLISIAHRNCKSLIALVNDILDIEKLDGGILTIKKNQFDLSQIVRDTVDANRIYATQVKITLDAHEIEPDLPVEGDAGRIAQVLSNLISNASKFSYAENCVKVVARRNGNRARVEVQDRGPGMSAEEQEHIFERFFQGSQATSSACKGTGLGLSISKRIMELHDGFIGFTSELGRGTTFWIELDLVK